MNKTMLMVQTKRCKDWDEVMQVMKYLGTTSVMEVTTIFDAECNCFRVTYKLPI